MGQQLGRFSADGPSRLALASVAHAPVWLLVAALAGCGGRLEPTASTLTASAASAPHGFLPDTAAPTQAVSPLAVPPQERAAAVRGVLLPGVPGTNAYSALQGHVEETADASASASQQLSAVIDRSATVGQVNAALIAVGARIVAMQPGNPELMLDLVQAARDPAARHAVAQLLATRAFTSVHRPGSAPATVQVGSFDAQAFDPSAPEPVDDHASPP